MNNIIEPPNKQITMAVNIFDNEHIIPVNAWYTFNIDPQHHIYIFIYVSAASNYRGIVTAVDKNNANNRTLFRDRVLDYYDQTVGQVDAPYAVNQELDFI
jgi:hypothetical protein